MSLLFFKYLAGAESALKKCFKKKFFLKRMFDVSSIPWLKLKNYLENVHFFEILLQSVSRSEELRLKAYDNVAISSWESLSWISH